MEKWIYEVISLEGLRTKNAIQAALNGEANNGWELVCVAEAKITQPKTEGGWNNEVLAFFKKKA